MYNSINFDTLQQPLLYCFGYFKVNRPIRMHVTVSSLIREIDNERENIITTIMNI